MQRYDQRYLQCSAPLAHVVFPSGFRSSFNRLASLLTSALNSHSVRRQVWNSADRNGRVSSLIFEIVDAYIPYQEPRPNRKDRNAQVHSTLSPFNSQSDLFPNGVLSEKWFDKYLRLKPCACVHVLEVEQGAESWTSLLSQIDSFTDTCLGNECTPLIILVSAGDSRPRLSNLASQARLPQSSILHLFHDSPTIDRDCELLVETLCSQILLAAPVFYSRIENRIKQRAKKYYTCPLSLDIDTVISISPKFLEARNTLKQAMINRLLQPQQVYISTQLFELAYENLVRLLATEFSQVLRAPQISDHDQALYNQVRTLIDVCCFHIVRALLCLSRPVDALDSHHLHLNAISECVPPGPALNNWKSIQYEWLAQLMLLVPHNQLEELSAASLVGSKSGYGDIYLFEGECIQSIPTLHPFMFIRASELLEKVSFPLTTTTAPDKYLFDYTNSSQVLVKVVDLLKRGSSELETLDTRYSALMSYLGWRISHHYAAINDGQALVSPELQGTFYRCSAFFSGRRAWDAGHLMTQEVLRMQATLQDVQSQIVSAMRLSIMPALLASITSAPHIALTEPVDIDIPESVSPLLHGSVLMCGPDAARTCAVGDDATIQTQFTSNFSSTRFSSFFGDHDVSLVIDSITMQFQQDGVDSDTMGVSHSDTEQTSILVVSKDLCANLAILQCELGICKILQANHVFTRVGVASLKLMQVHVSIAMANLVVRQKIEIECVSREQLHTLYIQPSESESVLEKLGKRLVLVDRFTANALQLKPTPPEVKVEIASGPFKKIVLGEAAAIPVTVSISDAPAFTYEKILISAKVHGLGNLVTRVSWDDLKDDEPLNLLDSIDKQHTMNVVVSAPPHIEQDITDKCVIELATQFEQQGHVAEHVLQSIQLLVSTSL